MRPYLPEIIQLVVGAILMAVLLYLGALCEGGWLALLCFLAAAVVYTGWWRVIISLGWRWAGKDPDDFDFHFPG
jgi:hypothetical protein